MSTLICDRNELTHFAGAFSAIALVHEPAPRFSTQQVEAIAGLFGALGEMATADLWTAAHQAGDQTPRPALDTFVPADPLDDLQCDSCQQQPHAE